MEHSERIEQAVDSYLGTLTTFVGDLVINPGESADDKGSTVIIVRVDGDMGDEEPPYSNNRWCDFVIELRTPVIQDDPNTDWLAQHKANAAALENAVLDDGFEAAISNSGLYVYRAVNRTEIREQNSDYWVSGMRFRLYSCRVN